jgi:hypothetical protein
MGYRFLLKTFFISDNIFNLKFLFIKNNHVMRIRKYVLTLGIVLLFTSSVFSQSSRGDDDILSYGGILIPGYINASASLTFGNLKGRYVTNKLVIDGQIKDYMLPELDVEVGIVDRLSLEMVTGYRKIVANIGVNAPKINKSKIGNKSVDGLNSIMLSANVGLLTEHKSRPSMYIQNQFYLPKTGYSVFQNEQLGYFATLNMENTLSDITYLDYGIGVGWDGNNSDPNAIYSFTINPNFMINDNIYAYGDFGGNYTKGSSPYNYFDIGTTVYFTEVFSMDASIGNVIQSTNFGKSTFGSLMFTFCFDAFSK